jgi:RimJ/RimL family protein N-acetyltransferase
MPEHSIHLEPATVEHITFLWYVRNQPDVYRQFRTPAPVSWEDHVAWVMPRLLGFARSRIWIITAAGKPAGHVRCDDRDDESAEISIALLKEFRGRGIAAAALRLTVDHLRFEKRIRMLHADVHQENAASQRLFEKHGFVFSAHHGAFRSYALRIV